MILSSSGFRVILVATLLHLLVLSSAQYTHLYMELFHTDGQCAFEDGLLYPDTSYGTTRSVSINTGTMWMDFDGDGDEDLFILTYSGLNKLYRSRSDGHLEPAPFSDLVTDAGSSSSAAWADVDNDGDLDVFVTADGGKNCLYLQEEDAHFRRVTNPSWGDIVADTCYTIGGQANPHIPKKNCASRKVLMHDINGDGWVDIAILNSATELNQLYFHVPGNLSFEQVPPESGDEFVLSLEANFDAELIDVNHDSFADIFVTGGYGFPTRVFVYVDGAYEEAVDHSLHLAADRFYTEIGQEDVNVDGLPDLLLASAIGYHCLMLQLANGTYVEELSFQEANQDVGSTGRTASPTFGDLDGDGYPEVLITTLNETPNLLYRNLGGTSWVVVTDSELVMIAESISSVSIVDFDHDGHLDVHMMPSSRNLNQGSTALTPLQSYFYVNDGQMGMTKWMANASKATYPFVFMNKPCVIDIDGDNDLDILEPLWGFEKPFTLFLNNGHGHYTPTPYTTRSGSINRWFVTSLECTDVEGDGMIDIFIGSWYPASAYVRLDANASTMIVVDEFPDLNEVASVVACDILGGSNKELIWVRSNLPFVVMTANNVGMANATLHEQGSCGLDVVIEGATHAICGDVNNDGYSDVFVTTSSDSSLHPNFLFRNEGGVRFSKMEFEAETLRSSSTFAAFHDYDQDGDLDLFVTNANSEPNQLLENIDGRGNFRAAVIESVTSTRSSSWSCVWADINLDDRQDLVVFNGDGMHELYINEGNGILTQEHGHAIVGAGAFKYAIAEDLDTDGDLDIIAARVVDSSLVFRSIFLFENKYEMEPIRFIDSFALPTFPTHGLITSYTVVDVTGDGVEDIVLGIGGYASTVDGEIVVLEASEEGVAGMLVHPFLGVESCNIFDITSEDIDQDGDQDIYVSCADVFIEERRQNHVFLNDGDGSFTKADSSLPFLGSSDVSTASALWHDWDGDGDSDLFMLNLRDTFRMFENHGSLNFSLVHGPWEDLPPMFPRKALVYDFNDDGFEDLFIITMIETPNFLYLHHGGLNFTLETSVLSSSPSSAVDAKMADFDLDGDQDLIIATVELNSDFTRDSEPNWFYRNDGNGSWTQVEDFLTGNSTRFSNIVLYEDLNADGIKDVFFGNGDIFTLQGEADDIFLSGESHDQDATLQKHSSMVTSSGVSVTSMVAVIEVAQKRFLLMDRNSRSVDLYQLIDCPLRPDDQCFSCPPGTYGVRGRCLDCPKGSYSSQYGSTSCDLCEPGPYYQDETGQTKCKTCPTGLFVRSGGATSRDQCVVCPRGTDLDLLPEPYHSCPCLPSFYRFTAMGECFSCPQDGSANCFEDTLEPTIGYWWNHSAVMNETNAPAEILQCPLKDSCLGGVNATCAAGYEGLACTTCQQGYYFHYNHCLGCPRMLPSIILVIVSLLVVVAIAVLLARSNMRLAFAEVRRVVSDMDSYFRKLRKLKLNTNANDASAREVEMVKKVIMRENHSSLPIISAFSRLKILVAFYQESMVLMLIFKNTLPRRFVEWTENIQFIDMDVFAFGSPVCMSSTARFDYLDNTLTTFGVFLLVILTILFLWMVRRVKQWYYKVPRVGFVHPDSKRSWQSYYAYSIACLRWTIFTIYLLYIPLSVRIFNILRCREVGDDRYLEFDYSIDCSSERYQNFRILSIILVCAFCIGVPLSFLILLWYRQRVVRRCVKGIVVEQEAKERTRRQPVRIRLGSTVSGPGGGEAVPSHAGSTNHPDLLAVHVSPLNRSGSSVLSCFSSEEPAGVGRVPDPISISDGLRRLALAGRRSHRNIDEANESRSPRGHIDLSSVFEGPSGDLGNRGSCGPDGAEAAAPSVTDASDASIHGALDSADISLGIAGVINSTDVVAAYEDAGDIGASTIVLAMSPTRLSSLSPFPDVRSGMDVPSGQSKQIRKGLQRQSAVRSRNTLQRDEGQVLLYDEQMFDASMVSLATSFLYENYRPGAYYWEVFEMFRRLMMTAVAVHLGSTVEANLFSGIIVCLVSISLLQLWQPYRRHKDFVLMRTALVALFFILWISLGLRLGVLTDSTFTAVLCMLLNMSVAAMLIFMIFQALQHIYSLRRAKLDEESKGAYEVSRLMVMKAMLKTVNPRYLLKNARIITEEGLDGLA